MTATAQEWTATFYPEIDGYAAVVSGIEPISWTISAAEAEEAVARYDEDGDLDFVARSVAAPDAVQELASEGPFEVGLTSPDGSRFGHYL